MQFSGAQNFYDFATALPKFKSYENFTCISCSFLHQDRDAEFSISEEWKKGGTTFAENKTHTRRAYTNIHKHMNAHRESREHASYRSSSQRDKIALLSLLVASWYMKFERNDEKLNRNMSVAILPTATNTTHLYTLFCPATSPSSVSLAEVAYSSSIYLQNWHSVCVGLRKEGKFSSLFENCLCVTCCVSCCEYFIDIRARERDGSKTRTHARTQCELSLVDKACVISSLGLSRWSMK